MGSCALWWPGPLTLLQGRGQGWGGTGAGPPKKEAREQVLQRGMCLDTTLHICSWDKNVYTWFLPNLKK